MSLLELETEAKPANGVMQVFTIQRVLIERVLAVTAGCASGSIQPILGNFCFEVEAGADAKITVTTSDAMVSAVVTVPLPRNVGAHSGKAVWPVSPVQAIVREASGDLITFTTTAKNGKFHGVIKSGTARWQLPLMSPAGFPSLEILENLVPAPRLELLAALKRVQKAVSKDSIKPYLMLVDVRKGKMRASDGLRFQQTATSFPFDAQIPGQVTTELINRLGASKQENIGVGQTERALLFRFGLTTLVVQKVLAKFPDVDEVLLKPALSNDLELLVDRAGLEAAIRKVRLVADPETSAVVLSLNPGSVTVEAKDRRGAVATEEVPAEWPHAPRHVSFNHKHLTDLLGSTDTAQVALRFGKDLKTRPSPLLLEDENLLAVLSQIRTDWL